MTSRALNRALLARQGLLEREALPVADVVRRAAGVQSQVASASVLGVLARSQATRADVVATLGSGEVVRCPWLRNTIHLVAADDFRALWPAVQPALLKAWRGFFGTRIRDLDPAPTVAAARAALEAEPLTYAELKRTLAPVEPDRDPEALAYAARSHLPTVQVPDPARPWGVAAAPRMTLAEGVTERDADATLARAYLAAFGPATVQDLQTWAGRTKLQGVVAAMDDVEKLGGGLLDLPGAPRPPEEADAPPRLLPEYDNAILGHADRSRIVADEHRPRVFPGSGRVLATMLVDGRVAGTWRVEDRRVVLEPFGRLAKADRAGLAEEAARVEATLP